MKKVVINVFAFVFTAMLAAMSANAVMAAPRLTLTPVGGPNSTNYSVGSTFIVTVGVNSETEKSSAVDVWATFDKTKLEIVTDGIKKASVTPFEFDMTPKFDNTTGTFQFSCVSTNMSAFDDAIINGNLATVIFRAKVAGTAALNFTCTAGSTTDSNIFNSDINDVISCGFNDVGSYIITGDSTTTTTTTTSTPTLTPTTTLTPSTGTGAATLPQTGAVGATIGLIVFGAISLASALFLKIL